MTFDMNLKLIVLHIQKNGTSLRKLVPPNNLVLQIAKSFMQQPMVTCKGLEIWKSAPYNEKDVNEVVKISTFHFFTKF
jgi:hypothetical protein